jgi:hypothetical protein
VCLLASSGIVDVGKRFGQAERGVTGTFLLPNVGHIVANVSAVHPAASRFLPAAAQTDAAAAGREKCLQYGVGEQIAAGGVAPYQLSPDTHRQISSVAHTLHR